MFQKHPSLPALAGQKTACIDLYRLGGHDPGTLVAEDHSYQLGDPQLPTVASISKRTDAGNNGGMRLSRAVPFSAGQYLRAEGSPRTRKPFAL